MPYYIFHTFKIYFGMAYTKFLQMLPVIDGLWKGFMYSLIESNEHILHFK